MTRSLPVLMYHYISRKVDGIAMPPDVFENQIKTLSKSGFKSVGLDEAEDYVLSGRKLPRKSCLLTFDDGYLDAYVHAWPILKRHGQKGIIFAVAGKLEQAAPPRHTLQDVWDNKIRAEDLPPVDAEDHKDKLGHPQRRDMFLNHEEARLMEASGVIRLASHSFKHRRIFAGHEFNDYYHPGPRPHTFDRVEGPVPWGLPCFKTAAFFSQPAFLPSQEVLEAARTIVPQDWEAAHEFFRDKTKIKRLARTFTAMTRDRLGRYETPEEYHGRIRAELYSCKALLEEELGRPQKTLAWPWGEYTHKAHEIALQLGFQVFFGADVGLNPPGYPNHVHRFKAKPKGSFWVWSRLHIYSRPWLAKVYSTIRI